MSSAALARKAQLGVLWPGIVAALSFSTVDILVKVVFASGMDVMTMVALRGLIVLPVMYVWLHMRPPLFRHSRRQRWSGLRSAKRKRRRPPRRGTRFDWPGPLDNDRTRHGHIALNGNKELS